MPPLRHQNYQAQLSVEFIIACDEEKCCWLFQLVQHGDACRSESGQWGKMDQGISAYIYVIFPSACLRVIIQQCRAEFAHSVHYDLPHDLLHLDKLHHNSFHPPTIYKHVQHQDLHIPSCHHLSGYIRAYLYQHKHFVTRLSQPCRLLDVSGHPYHYREVLHPRSSDS